MSYEYQRFSTFGQRAQGHEQSFGVLLGQYDSRFIEYLYLDIAIQHLDNFILLLVSDGY